MMDIKQTVTELFEPTFEAVGDSDLKYELKRELLYNLYCFACAVYPDYAAMDAEGLTSVDLPKIMEGVRADLNKMVAPYERIDGIQLRANEFEKTPKRSIKRYLYN